MKDFIRLTDLQANDVYDIFNIADEITEGNFEGALTGKSVVMFFPASSIRTRVTFEKAVYLSGGQPILFPTDALDKKEDLRDVCGYLNNWADIIIVRHKDIQILEKIAKYAKVPVINAMTDCNHPCEILSDLYSLSKIRKDFTYDSYLFCGTSGNIGQAWKEALDMASPNAVLNPCPPFYRGEEVSDEAIESEYFVGYEFKKNLLKVQQAVMIWCLKNV